MIVVVGLAVVDCVVGGGVSGRREHLDLGFFASASAHRISLEMMTVRISG